MAHINPIDFVNTNAMTDFIFNRKRDKINELVQIPPAPKPDAGQWTPIKEVPLANANIQSKVICVLSILNEYGYEVNARYTPIDGKRLCLLKVPCFFYDEGVTSDTTDFYVPISNVADLSACFGYPATSGQPNKARYGALYWNYYTSTFTRQDIWDTEDYPQYTRNLEQLTSTNLNNAYIGSVKEFYNFTPTAYNTLYAISQACTCYSIPWGQVVNGVIYQYAFPIAPHNWHSNIITVNSITNISPDIPIFDGTDAQATARVKKYIETGEIEGNVDPFDPNNPEKETVEDIKTDYKVFISPDEEDKNRTHYTVVAYNSDYMELGDSVKGLYGMHTIATTIPQTLQPVAEDLGYSTQSKYPTQGAIYTPKPNTGYNISFRFEELNDPTNADKWYTVTLAYDKIKESNCRITDVLFDSLGVGGTKMSRSNIPDGYKFTYTDGTVTRFVDVIFRHITIDDLKDGYPDPDDIENTSTGTDTTFAGASGLHTYAITESDFNVINNKLWSTDWTQVFKSSTIDPVKCVIACKSIPFTANVSNSADVFIANMDTGLHKNYVKTVKSFNVGTGIYIPAFNGDFTDITMTRIHCYLPYIGWVELPASECVSRNAYRNVPANIKRVSFKYLVDFVDGTCRCIVSVNGTERWFFDGNCSIDVPVTSDNHTQAISNALRSGVQTGLSIISGVVGAVSGNAGAVAGGVVGAMTSAPNIFPTYNYTATSNGSGYINASMNTNIILVVERPNVVRPIDYSKRVGRPCGLSLQLGGLRGFTKCSNVDVSGITATDNELNMIKSLLETGVYL